MPKDKTALDDIASKLKESFETKDIGWRIYSYNKPKTKAMITFYIDARAVQKRLNEVLGIDGWSFTINEVSKENGVHGRLTTYSGERRVAKEDIGYAGNSDKAEWAKDATSDALKRCAVHLGIGAFLYELPALWINLNETEQKYLTETQNDYCQAWLESQLDGVLAPVDPGKILPAGNPSATNWPDPVTTDWKIQKLTAAPIENTSVKTFDAFGVMYKYVEGENKTTGKPYKGWYPPYGSVGLKPYPTLEKLKMASQTGGQEEINVDDLPF